MAFVYENPFSLSNPSQMSASTAFQINNNITIGSSPATINASHNPIYWQLSSSATTQSTTYSQITFEVIGVPDDGNFILISGDSSNTYPTIQLVCATNPGAGQIYSNSTVPAKGINDLAQCIASVLNNDFNFKQRFYAVVNSNKVTIQAKRQGARYNLNFLSTDPDINLTSTIDSGNWNRGQILKDYTIYADVYVGSSGFLADLTSRLPATRVGTVEIDYQPNNLYTFDVSSFVEPYVRRTTPTINSSTFIRDNGTITNVFLVFGERYDEFSNNYRKTFPVGQTDIVWVHNAALDFSQTNDLSNYFYDFSIANTNKPFLTNQPTSKETFSNQKEFLSVLVEGNSNFEIFIDGVYEYWNGTQVGYVDKFTTSVTSGGCFTADVSYSNMGFTGSTAIRRYTARLWRRNLSTSNITPVSITQTYNVLPDCPSEYQTNIIWLNSLGGWDSFMFNGEIEEKIKRKSDEFITAPDYTPSTSERLNTDYNINIEKTTTLKSSWINKDHFDWLADLAKSDDVRYLSGSTWIPVTLNDFKYELDSLNDLYQVTIEYKIARELNLNSNN